MTSELVLENKFIIIDAIKFIKD